MLKLNEANIVRINELWAIHYKKGSPESSACRATLARELACSWMYVWIPLCRSLAFFLLRIKGVVMSGTSCNQAPNLYDCFRSSMFWTAQLVAKLCYSHCKNPVRAAEAKLKRVVSDGDASSDALFAIDPPKAAELLHVDTLGIDAELASGHLAWIGEKYYQQQAQAVQVWWPTKNFAKRYGSWTGCEYPKVKHCRDMNHALLCSATWAGLLKRDGDRALNDWKSEKRVEHDFQKQRREGAVPDGLLGNCAIETLGRYPEIKIRDKVVGLSLQFPRVEVWGIRL